jgi:MoxR-like ATPase
MSATNGFLRYRGDGTTRDGRPAPTPGEQGAYIADADLVAAVNTALAVEQPLLVTGDAGTGKTVLAYSIAAELEMGAVEVFPVRSDNQGRDLLYDFDNLQRFYDAQTHNERARDRANYLTYGALGRAFQSAEPKLVLIDEVDKAPRDFPNDLLYALDRMELRIPELDRALPAKRRPVVVITSNRESQLPDPFLRRCVFHHIERPDAERLRRILDQRLGHLELAERLRERIVARFVELREVKGLQKTPSTSEMLTWARVLKSAGVSAEALEGPLSALPYTGAVIKTREDMERVKPKAR